jgi:hypothetical protein
MAASNVLAVVCSAVAVTLHLWRHLHHAQQQRLVAPFLKAGVVCSRAFCDIVQQQCLF